MTLLAMKHTVQLLHDARGIYGVGLVDRAVENDRCPPEDLILRPDRLLQAQTPGATALPMIIGGFRHGMFSHMASASELGVEPVNKIGGVADFEGIKANIPFVP